jgi:hypothetical protein
MQQYQYATKHDNIVLPNIAVLPNIVEYCQVLSTMLSGIGLQMTGVTWAAGPGPRRREFLP